MMTLAMTIALPESDDALLAECDVTTFRASGPGGQHVNKTDSAVRLKHCPSGVVVTCRRERSQHLNKLTCLRRLREKVAALNFEAPPRVPSKVSRSAVERRLKEKARQSAVKRARGKPAEDED
jgi:ribosome-associated protein